MTVVPAITHDRVPPTEMTSVQLALLPVSINPSSVRGIVGALVRHTMPRPVPKHCRASNKASGDRTSPGALSEASPSDGTPSGRVNRHAASAMQANGPSDLTPA